MIPVQFVKSLWCFECNFNFKILTCSLLSISLKVLQFSWSCLQFRWSYKWSAWNCSQLFTCSTWITVISSITTIWMSTNIKWITWTRRTAMTRIKVSVNSTKFPPKVVEQVAELEKKIPSQFLHFNFLFWIIEEDSAFLWLRKFR